MYPEKYLKKCTKCGREFDFSGEKRQVAIDSGLLYEPKKCLECRHEARCLSNNKPLYPYTCSKCKRLAHVTFLPHPSRPLYCTDCLIEKKNSEKALTPTTDES